MSNAKLWHELSLNNQNDMKIKVRIPIMFAGLLNLDSNVKNDRTRRIFVENIKISAKENLGNYELKQHKLSRTVR
jgi:hypothetical protein